MTSGLALQHIHFQLFSPAQVRRRCSIPNTLLASGHPAWDYPRAIPDEADGIRFGPIIKRSCCECEYCSGEGGPMTNSKLQAALDELERLHDTVREYKSRNGKLPGDDS